MLLVFQPASHVSVLKHNPFSASWTQQANSSLMFVEPQPRIHCLHRVQLYRRVINQFGARLPLSYFYLTAGSFRATLLFYSRRPSSATANFTASPVYKYVHLFLEALKCCSCFVWGPSTTEQTGSDILSRGSKGMAGLLPWWTVKSDEGRVISSPSACTFFFLWLPWRAPTHLTFDPNTWLKSDCKSEHVGRDRSVLPNQIWRV